jgi:hypothetical protein
MHRYGSARYQAATRATDARRASRSSSRLALHLRNEVVYYGIAEQSLRDVLRRHAEVERARINPREALTGFTFECPPDPDRRRRELTFRFIAS